MKFKLNKHTSKLNMRNIKIIIQPTKVIKNDDNVDNNKIGKYHHIIHGDDNSDEISDSSQIECENKNLTRKNVKPLKYASKSNKHSDDYDEEIDDIENDEDNDDYDDDHDDVDDEDINNSSNYINTNCFESSQMKSSNLYFPEQHQQKNDHYNSLYPGVLDETYLNDYFKKTRRNTKNKTFSVSICLTYSRYTVVSKIAKSLGWKVVKESSPWNIFWTDSAHNAEIHKDMKRYQKINHFPGMGEICRKDLLARNLNRMLKLFPFDFDIFPKTWCFPADLGDAIAWSKEHRTKTFIIKPDQGAQGRGIWLTKSLKDIKPHERMICQVYISRPLLIDGYKFDLRIYTLVTSIDPLRIFVHNEGLVRFATNKYREPCGQNTSNIYMHLTNYSVNKRSRTFCKDNEDGSKRKLSTLNRILKSEGYDVVSLWKRIDDIIVKTILSAWPTLKHNYHACFTNHDIMQGCFEILGFDIIIDSKLRPYLLEVNHSPSFHTDEPVDKDVKEALLRDTFLILNISQIDKRKVVNDDRKRVQNRLLQKTKDTNNINALIVKDLDEKVNTTSTVNPILQQIDWEESHLGGFRRVMPPSLTDGSNPDRYKQFYLVNNQSSIFADTAASKRREEAAKQLRREILERESKLQKFLKKPSSNKNKSINSKTSKYQKFIKKRKYEQIVNTNNWMTGNFINDNEEKQRLLSLANRDYLIRSSGVVEIICEAFYRFELLSQSDYNKYNNLIEKIKMDENLKNHYQELDDEIDINNYYNYDNFCHCNINENNVRNINRCQEKRFENHSRNQIIKKKLNRNKDSNNCPLNKFIYTKKIL